MNTHKSENELQIGDNDQYSERLKLSFSDNNKINIQMSIACDESGEGQFVSKQLTLEQFEELAKFCNEKLAQMKAQKAATIQKIQNPVIVIQKDELKLQIHCHKNWEQQLAFTYSHDTSYLSFFANDVNLFIDLSFDGFGLNLNGNSDLNYQFNDFHDKFAYLIAYTVLTQQHDKFMQLIQSVHDVLPFNNLYLDNRNCDRIGTWHTNIWINKSCFEFSEEMIDVQSFFKKIEYMYGLNNIDDDFKNVIHQHIPYIPLLDNVLNDDVELKKLLFGNPEINFIKIG